MIAVRFTFKFNGAEHTAVKIGSSMDNCRFKLMETTAARTPASGWPRPRPSRYSIKITREETVGTFPEHQIEDGAGAAYEAECDRIREAIRYDADGLEIIEGGATPKVVMVDDGPVPLERDSEYIKKFVGIKRRKLTTLAILSSAVSLGWLNDSTPGLRGQPFRQRKSK